jgi:succinate dehydrogenase hydrophobic anchor subunit
MRAFWRKYFHIPQDGCISDRVFLYRMALHMALIVLCLACMAYSAYALFSFELPTVFHSVT